MSGPPSSRSSLHLESAQRDIRRIRQAPEELLEEVLDICKCPRAKTATSSSQKNELKKKICNNLIDREKVRAVCTGWRQVAGRQFVKRHSLVERNKLAANMLPRSQKEMARLNAIRMFAPDTL